jgi:FkbM family methyltransferase
MKTKFDINIYQIRKKDFKSAYVINDLKYALFPNDNAVSSSIINGWQYEPYMFEFLNKNLIETTGKEIIDIGANNGSFAIDFAHLVGDEGKVYAFEPQRLIYYQLCGNVFMNGLDNVYCYNYALGCVTNTVYMQKPDYYDKGNVNFGNVKVDKIDEDINKRFDLLEGKLKPNKEYVTQILLDNFEFNDVVFIKIDVQGYELNAIKGAVRTIKKHRPYLFVEFEEDLLQETGTSETELKSYIESLGYLVKRFQEGIPYSTTSGKCLDCVCIPKEKFEEFNHIIP